MRERLVRGARVEAKPREDSLVVACLPERVAQPFQTLVETVTRSSTG